MTEVRPCWRNTVGHADPAQQMWVQNSQTLQGDLGPGMWYRWPTLWCVGHTHSHSSCGSRVIRWVQTGLQRTRSDVTTSLTVHWWCSVEGLGHKCCTGEDSRLWAALFHENLALGFTGIMGGVILQPLAFGLKFVKDGSPEDVGTFLLGILIINNHLVIYIFLLGRRSSGVMSEVGWSRTAGAEQEDLRIKREGQSCV